MNDDKVAFAASLVSARTSNMKQLFRGTISSSERKTILQWLLDAEKDLIAYQKEIGRLRAHILALENKHDQLNRWRERYRILLSPIHRMPPELLVRVFAFCCEENVSEPSRLPPAVTLTQVSGRWRDIALTTPSLWASVFINFRDWSGNHQKLETVVKAFMERSQTALLKVTLDFSHVKYNSITVMVPAINILAQNSTRWSDFLWRISAGTIHHPAFHAIRGKLPRLKNLEMFSYPFHMNINQEAQSATGLDIFAECPSLSSVRFSPDLTGGIQFPSAQIRSLGLRVSYIAGALRILSGFPNIESLELFRVGGGKACQNHLISDLKHLSIKASDQDDVSSILKHTTLQFLSVLQISAVTEAPVAGWENWDGVPIENFLLRSSCCVTTLHLCYLPITSKQTISLLTLLPSLRELHVRERMANDSCNKIVTGHLLESLQISFCHFAGDLRALVPRLTDLLLAVYLDDLNTDALMKVVTSRWLPNADDAAEAGIDCLRSIVIILGGEKFEAGQNHKLSPLLDFRDAGLRVNIESSST